MLEISRRDQGGWPYRHGEVVRVTWTTGHDPAWDAAEVPCGRDLGDGRVSGLSYILHAGRHREDNPDWEGHDGKPEHLVRYVAVVRPATPDEAAG